MKVNKKPDQNDMRAPSEMHGEDDFVGIGEFVSGAPLGKIEDASRKSRQSLETAFHRLESLLNQSFDSDKFYANVAEAQAALKEALWHRKEHDRLDNIRGSERGHYR